MNSVDSFYRPLTSEAAHFTETLEASPRTPADWDESVRAAFSDDCMIAGVETGILLEALQHARHPEMRRLLAEALDRAAHRASRGWAAIDRCLAEWGELSACAFERAIEEAALQLRREEHGGARGKFARGILDRARLRLSQFRSRTAFAA